MRKLRGNLVGMIFQDAATALNPLMTVGAQIEEVMAIHRTHSRAERRSRAVELLAAVGVPDAAQRARNRPHQLSGGMRQRVMIAVALAGDPDLVIADEPTTALDVTVQAQVLALLHESTRDSAVLFITHDMGVVAEIADRVVVMYAGAVVESGPIAEVLERPHHPYTVGAAGVRARSGRAARRRPAHDSRPGTAARRARRRLPVPRPLPQAAGQMRRTAAAGRRPRRRVDGGLLVPRPRGQPSAPVEEADETTR